MPARPMLAVCPARKSVRQAGMRAPAARGRPVTAAQMPRAKPEWLARQALERPARAMTMPVRLVPVKTKLAWQRLVPGPWARSALGTTTRERLVLAKTMRARQALAPERPVPLVPVKTRTARRVLGKTTRAQQALGKTMREKRVPETTKMVSQTELTRPPGPAEAAAGRPVFRKQGFPQPRASARSGFLAESR